MPLYEYECRECHRHTEKIQKFSDAEITVCPHCGGPLERVISAPAIAFKGGGWYADGYGNKKSGGAGDSKSSESKGGEAKGGGETKSSDAGSKSTQSAGSSSKDSGGSSGSSGSGAAASAPAAPASSSVPTSGTK